MLTYNERLSFLMRKNQGRLDMPKYIKELGSLVRDDAYEVIGLEASDVIMGKIRENWPNYSRIKRIYTELPFEDRTILKRIVKNIAVDKRCYLSMGYSEICGIAELNDITRFNADFRWEDEHTGMITLYSYDLINELIIDFYEEYNEYFIDLDLYGYRWNQYMSNEMLL
ncbi:MAG: hypothetical protein J6T28_11460 [Paludibacteraceae bacterium]|nr:hypothetical protein [Paludibacteraceae bacterium]MBP5480779.1 hypothetical protein [Paludibacteraceae bacterium]